MYLKVRKGSIYIYQNSQVIIKRVISFTIPQVRYMQEQKYGGAFVWALDLDDFNGQFCGEGSHPLLSHLRTLLNIGTWHDLNLIIINPSVLN